MKTTKECKVIRKYTKQLLGILGLIRNTSLVFLSYGYNALTKTWYKVQISSKITDLEPLRLAKFESFWIQVCAIVAVSGIPRDISLYSLEFDRVFLMIFYRDFLLLSQKIPLLLLVAFPPFYSVILRSQGTIDSPPLLLGYQSPFCAHHPEGWAFPCFS